MSGILEDIAGAVRGIQRKSNIVPLIIWTILAAYYAVGLAGMLYSPFHKHSLQIINSGSEKNHSETALIEMLEACFWFAAVFVCLLVLKKRIAGHKPILWICVFGIVSVAALGEELSWGQSLFGFSSPKTFSELNAQRETNLHNLNLAEMTHLSKESPLYPHLKNVTELLNPAFYLFCFMIWMVIPIGHERIPGIRDIRILANYPNQNKCFYLLFGVFTILFFIVDQFMFDAGEVYELTISIAGFLVALNQYPVD